MEIRELNEKIDRVFNQLDQLLKDIELNLAWIEANMITRAELGAKIEASLDRILERLNGDQRA
jgi:hypothetical protein